MFVPAFCSWLCGYRDRVITLAAARNEQGSSPQTRAGLILPAPLYSKQY